MRTACIQPSVFLIGSTKSGTTSLYHYFKAHPRLFLPELKEPHYFSMPEYSIDCQNIPGKGSLQTDLVYDEKHYLDLYAGCRDDQIALDCSTSYLNYPSSAERIHKFNPQSKILAILRHPVERAFSAYSHLSRENVEHLNLRDALKEESRRIALNYGGLWKYRQDGHYTNNLIHFEKIFGRSRMKVVLFDDLLADPAALLKDIYLFLNLPSVPPKNFLQHNVSGKVRLRALFSFVKYPSPAKAIAKKILPLRLLQSIKARTLTRLTDKLVIPADIALELSQYYQKEIYALESWMGRDLEDWKTRYCGD